MQLARNLAVQTAITPSSVATGYSPPFELVDDNACSVGCTVIAITGANVDAANPTKVEAVLETSSDLENWSSDVQLFETTVVGEQAISVSDVARRYARLRFTVTNGDGTNETEGISIASVRINTASLP